MPNQFSEVMAERSDAELIAIVTLKRSDYQPEAVAAAEQEIEKRSLSVTQVQAASEIVAIEEAERLRRASSHLSLASNCMRISSQRSAPISNPGSMNPRAIPEKHRSRHKQPAEAALSILPSSQRLLFSLKCFNPIKYPTYYGVLVTTGKFIKE